MLFFPRGIRTEERPGYFQRSYGGTERFSEYRNGSETFTERLGKAKMRPGGKKVVGKEFRKENKQFQAARCFSSFSRVGLVSVELGSAEVSWI